MILIVTVFGLFLNSKRCRNVKRQLYMSYQQQYKESIQDQVLSRYEDDRPNKKTDGGIQMVSRKKKKTKIISKLSNSSRKGWVLVSHSAADCRERFLILEPSGHSLYIYEEDPSLCGGSLFENLPEHIISMTSVKRVTDRSRTTNGQSSRCLGISLDLKNCSKVILGFRSESEHRTWLAYLKAFYKKRLVERRSAKQVSSTNSVSKQTKRRNSKKRSDIKFLSSQDIMILSHKLLHGNNAAYL
eukprot:1003852_1